MLAHNKGNNVFLPVLEGFYWFQMIDIWLVAHKKMYGFKKHFGKIHISLSFTVTEEISP